jgi:hypothetical protein
VLEVGVGILAQLPFLILTALSCRLPDLALDAGAMPQSLKGSSYGLIQTVVASQFSCHLLGDCIIFSGQGTAPCCFDVFTVASSDVHCPPALVVAV